VKASQRVANILECIRDRVSLGEEFGQKWRGHGVSALRLGLEDERQLVIHQCTPVQENQLMTLGAEVVL
jgi:hypothetical protein